MFSSIISSLKFGKESIDLMLGREVTDN